MVGLAFSRYLLGGLSSDVGVLLVSTKGGVPLTLAFYWYFIWGTLLWLARIRIWMTFRSSIRAPVCVTLCIRARVTAVLGVRLVWEVKANSFDHCTMVEAPDFT